MTPQSLLILDELDDLCANYLPDQKYRHDRYITRCLRQAIGAARKGNFGVGAILVDSRDEAIEAQNRVFHPYFRSDRHAEMELITKFEESTRGAVSPASYTLYSSLEPCPMCLTRILISGVGATFYATANDAGGMRGLLSHLPTALQGYAEQKIIAQADCSQFLRTIAWRVFEINATSNSQQILQRGIH